MFSVKTYVSLYLYNMDNPIKKITHITKIGIIKITLKKYAFN